MKTRIRALALALLAIVSATLNSRGAVDAFIRFTNPVGSAVAPVGESKDAQFPGKNGWNAITSFDSGILTPVTIGSATGGAGAGKATFQEFHFTKPTDASSPALFKTSATGGHYEQAELVLRQVSLDGKPLKPFYTAKFRTVFVNSMDWSGPGDEGPEESVAIFYFAIEWSFTRFDQDGTPSTTLTVNWNQVAGAGGEGPFLPPTLSYPAAQSVLTGGSLNVSPLTGPSDSDGIPSIVFLSNGGYTGGITLDSASGTVRITGAAPVGGPYAIVVKATDGLGLSTEASFNLLVNDLPALLANPDTASRLLGNSIKIPTDTLTANDSAGAIFDGLPSDVTTLGGHVSLSDSTITYQPPTPDPGTDDKFAYRIRDSFGQTQTGTVTIHVDIPDGPSNLAIRVTRAETTLQLTGVPLRKYQLQKALDVTGPWNDFGDVVAADVNGLASWTDPDPASPRFYRAYSGQ